jgi:uncharacterized membrane protein HdeD (DUF308 family)
MGHGATGPIGSRLGSREPTAAVVVELTPDEARAARRWLMVTGVLALIGGIVSIAVPPIASVAIATFVGVVLMYAGIVMGVNAFAQPTRRRTAWRLIEAALTVAAGICLVAFPLTGTLTLTFFLAAWFFAQGVLLLAMAPRVPERTARIWTTVNGVLSLLLGVLIVADLPSSAGWAIGLLVGVNLVFFGVRALVAAHELKETAER